MLDEPFAGIDPVTVQNIQSVIRRLRDDGISILITDHAAREILQVTDRCYVINQGSVLCQGDPEEIKRHPEVRRIYLGDMDPGVSGPPPPHMPSQSPRRRDDLSVSPRWLLRKRRKATRSEN
jgi:lipopolysaccharide export system ATP-binding protein